MLSPPSTRPKLTADCKFISDSGSEMLTCNVENQCPIDNINWKCSPKVDGSHFAIMSLIGKCSKIDGTICHDDSEPCEMCVIMFPTSTNQGCRPCCDRPGNMISQSSILPTCRSSLQSDLKMPFAQQSLNPASENIFG